MKTMIRNGIVVPMNRNMDVWPDGYVVFEGSKILEAGPVDGLDVAIIRYGGEHPLPSGHDPVPRSGGRLQGPFAGVPAAYGGAGHGL